MKKFLRIITLVLALATLAAMAVACADPVGPNDGAEPEMMTAVIECWGSESYRRTTPALFETNMKYKYTDREVSVEMFDILREGSSFDQGRIYANTLGPYMSEIPSKIATLGGSWATSVSANKSRIERQLMDIVESFRKIR